LFCAAVFETTGGISDEGLSFFRQLFRFAARQQGQKLSTFAGRAWARLSCNLHTSVAQAILHRVPTGGHPQRVEKSQSFEYVPCSPELWEDAEGGSGGEPDGPGQGEPALSSSLSSSLSFSPSSLSSSSLSSSSLSSLSSSLSSSGQDGSGPGSSSLSSLSVPNSSSGCSGFVVVGPLDHGVSSALQGSRIQRLPLHSFVASWVD